MKIFSYILVMTVVCTCNDQLQQQSGTCQVIHGHLGMSNRSVPAPFVVVARMGENDPVSKSLSPSTWLLSDALVTNYTDTCRVRPTSPDLRKVDVKG